MLRNAKEYLQINDVQDIYIDTYILTYIDIHRELLLNSTLTFVGVLRVLEDS